MNPNAFLTIFALVSLLQFSFADLPNLWSYNPSTIIVENQLQAAVRGQQQLAKRLIRNGVEQVQRSTNQLQAAKYIQTTATNTVASKGLSDLNNIGRLILSPGIRQCYQLNQFTFGDAIDAAKTQAMQCVTDKINEGKSIIDSARNNIETAANDIGNGAQMIAECSQMLMLFPSVAGAIAKAACLNQALIGMKSAAIILPINLAKRILEASDAIGTIESDIIKCNLDILLAIVNQAKKAGEAINDCISRNSVLATSTTAFATTA